MSIEQEQYGWLINAGNHKTSFQSAAASAMLLKIHSGISVAVCVDQLSKWPAEYEQYVDYVIEYPFGDTSQSMPQHAQLNQWQLYHITPFQNNLVIEADVLVCQNLDYAFNLGEKQTVQLPTQIHDFRKSIYEPPHVKFFEENNIKKAHAGIWFFKTGEDFSLAYFNMLDVVCKNWREIFKNYFKPEHVPDFPELDILHSCTVKMLDEYEHCTVQDPSLLTYTYMISKPDEKWNDVMNTWYTDSFKIDNYRQNGVLKFTEHEMMNEIVFDGIRNHYTSTNRSS